MTKISKKKTLKIMVRAHEFLTEASEKKETYSETIIRLCMNAKVLELKEIYESQSQSLNAVLEELNIPFKDYSSDYAVNVYIDSDNKFSDEKEEELINILEKVTDDSVHIHYLTYLTSDRNFHSPRVDYYRTEDNMMTILSDSEPTYIDEEWSKELCEQLGNSHPDRVLSVLKEFSEKGEEIEINGYIFDFKNEYLLDVDIDQNIIIYRILEELEYEELHQSHRIHYKVINIDKMDKDGDWNKEDEEEIFKLVSHWQGSADYELRSPDYQEEEEY